MTRIRRGYTLTELVVASALTLAVGLGGLTAVQLSRRANKSNQAVEAALLYVTSLDRRAGTRPACQVVPGTPVPEDVEACNAWRRFGRGETLERHGTLPDGLVYRQQLTMEHGPGRLIRVETRFSRDGTEVLRHALLVPSR